METEAVTSAEPMVTGVDCLAMPPTSAAMAISAEWGTGQSGEQAGWEQLEVGCGAQQGAGKPCAQLPRSLPRGPEPDALLTRGVGKGKRHGSRRKVGVDDALDGAQLHLGGLQWMSSPSGLMQSSASSRATSCCRAALNSVQLGGTLAAAVTTLPLPLLASARMLAVLLASATAPRRASLVAVARSSGDSSVIMFDTC